MLLYIIQRVPTKQFYFKLLTVYGGSEDLIDIALRVNKILHILLWLNVARQNCFS